MRWYLSIYFLAMIICGGCCSRKSESRIEGLSFDEGSELIVYDTVDTDSVEFLNAAKLADDYHLQGKVVNLIRHPSAEEVDLFRWAMSSRGDEMLEKEINNLYFLKTSFGLTVRQKGLPEFTQTGRTTGYRIIYGPAKSPHQHMGYTTEGKFDFNERLAVAIPACLVVENLIGLGKGYVMVQAGKYFSLPWESP